LLNYVRTLTNLKQDPTQPPSNSRISLHYTCSTQPVLVAALLSTYRAYCIIYKNNSSTWHRPRTTTLPVSSRVSIVWSPSDLNYKQISFSISMEHVHCELSPGGSRRRREVGRDELQPCTQTSSDLQRDINKRPAALRSTASKCACAHHTLSYVMWSTCVHRRAASLLSQFILFNVPLDIQYVWYKVPRCEAKLRFLCYYYLGPIYYIIQGTARHLYTCIV